MNKEYSKEEIIGLCEAYEFYNILPNDLQAKIPQKLVDEMKEYSKYNYGEKINCKYDIDAKRLSKKGIANIAYMCLLFS